MGGHVIGLAAVAAGLATWCWLRPPGEGLARCRALPPEPRPKRASVTVAVMVALAAGVVCAWMLGGGRAGAVMLAAALMAGTGVLLGGRLRRRARRAAERAEVARAATVLAGLLAAGHVPASALTTAASESPVLRGAAGSLRVGGDVPTALRREAEVPGRGGLADLAAAWVLAERTGASLKEAVSAMAEHLSGRQEVARTVAIELAAPRATGRVMAVLPVVGVGLGFVFGGNPLEFLVATPVGWMCLVAGVAAMCAGVLWTEMLADRAGGD